ncbi:MAG: c-type cytochrome [Proteobacteria bacterium]|jgi:cytochrome c553|nr:c-type cytochrome [Pseudomonadota bacterium]MDA1299738.1 c-type cytochrome [Pseudomonadota bacterium]
MIAALLAAGQTVAEGNAERGKSLNGTCVACHGEVGNSLAGSFPNIAGQNELYLLKQLRDIQTGAREAPLMTGMLDSLDDQDLEDLAAFYAGQQPSMGAADPALADLGEQIYRAGISRKGVAACTSCHSPTGQGNALATVPLLSGQWPEYTVAQLKAFRSGARMNDGDARMMRLSAMDLSDREIDALATYVYGLH